MGQGGRDASKQRPQGKGRAKIPTMRGDWMIEPETTYKASSQSLRGRLLLFLLAAVVVLGAAIFLVPGAKSRLLAFLPGSQSSATAPAAASGGGSTLTLQVNAPSATVTLDGKAYPTTASQTAPFSSVAVQSLAAGAHTLMIHAANFTDYSGSITMPASNTTMTAWLAPGADALTALGKQSLAPATQPDPGVVGDQYKPGSRAAGALKVSISYSMSGLTASAFKGQLAPNGDTNTSPFSATLSLIPIVTFTNAAGTQIYQYKPQAFLPPAQFALQTPITFDAKDNPQFGTPTIKLASNVTTNFSGPAGKDYALYYALASILPASPANALSFTCVGAVDNKNFNPEDGLFITEAGGAHYFYRWGLFWATNQAAQTLTPTAPHALPNSNEFNDANTAHQNGSCGS